jgi:hypothetical protein
MRNQIRDSPAERLRYADFAEETDFTENQSLKNYFIKIYSFRACPRACPREAGEAGEAGAAGEAGGGLAAYSRRPDGAMTSFLFFRSLLGEDGWAGRRK